jgi:Domain of unknown function (DUF5615)
LPHGALLDADVQPAVAVALRQLGYDVVAASGDAALQTLEDAQLLRLATSQHRVHVTFNIADFAEVARRFAHMAENHAGIILIHSRSYRRTDIGGISRALDTMLRTHGDFTNSALYLTR